MRDSESNSRAKASPNAESSGTQANVKVEKSTSQEERCWQHILRYHVPRQHMCLLFISWTRVMSREGLEYNPGAGSVSVYMKQGEDHLPLIIGFPLNTFEL